MSPTLAADADYRVTSPLGVSRSVLQRDATRLIPLLDEQSSLSIYTRSSPDFENVRKVHNTATTIQPLALIRPVSDSEVTATVRFSAKHKIPFAIRNGGHDQWGRALVENGVVLDMRAIDHIEIAEDQKSVRIGGGVMSGTLQRYLNGQKLFTPSGFCNTVGYTGWAVGGGYGVLQGAYGMGADQILSARVVTASGEVIDTNNDHELLWAVRGAGNGNFGVIQELRVKVYPMPRMLGGLLAFPLAEAPQVFDKLENLHHDGFPDSFSGDMLIAKMPALGPVVLFLWNWAAKDDSDFCVATEFLEKCQKFGTVLLNTVNETTPSGFAAALEPMTSGFQPFFFRSCLVKNFSQKLAAIVVQHPPPLESCTVVTHNAHGQCILPNPYASFANRFPHVLLGISAALPPGSLPTDPQMQIVVEWANSIVTALMDADIALEGGYMNFSPPEECDTVRFYGADSTARLKMLKKKYDPENLFAKSHPPLA